MDTAAPGSSGLITQLRADQSERWHRGECVPVEAYLARYPTLASNPEAVLDLILAEMQLRAEAGDTPTLEEYLARFPAQADVLRVHERLQRFLGAPASTGSELRTGCAKAGDAALPRLPGYELLEEVGRGGMGVVYKARQAGLGRVVAVKLVRSGPLAGAEELARFRTEARAIGRLDHPGVVRVHAFGEDHGWLYLAMEYLPQGSLADRLRRGPLPPAEAARLVRGVALAVQAAHDAGVVHRDLKPGNILLGAGGEPKVSDFGLARLLDRPGEHTRTGAPLGTPAYMAPEQARGEHVGPAADVYGLGTVLYQALTGRPPFRGEGHAAVLERVRSEEPAAPRRLQPGVPAALEAVCLRCLEKEPARRYGSAAELADELGRWLAGQPTRTRPPGLLTRAGRWLARRPRLLAALTVALLVLAATFLLTREGPSQQALLEVHQALAGEAPVVLVPARSRPRWSDWPLHEGIGHAAADGAFAIESLAQVLLELARDPQKDRFRFRARIRHQSSPQPTGAVGLYVGRQQVAVDGRAGHFFLKATFNDVLDEDEQIRRGMKLARHPPPLPEEPILNRVALFAALDQGKGVRYEGIGSDQFQGEVRLFRPDKPPGRRWREFTLDVTPERIVVRFDGKPAGDYAMAGLREIAAPTWGRQRVTTPLQFNPRGGLGLIVSGGVASFSDVVVEPLPD